MSEEHRPVPTGWTAYPPERLPAPTGAPALFAFGVTLLAWGVVSSFVVSIIGAAVLLVSLLHWIGEIAHDAK
jgi:heme/copper-type cytochrome/quinol oxidase subunit 1